MNPLKLPYNFKQDIELFFFFLGNSTFNLRHPLSSEFNYLNNLKRSPSLFLEVSLIFINALQQNSYSHKTKDEIIEFMYKNTPKGNYQSNNSLSPYQCLADLIHKLSKIKPEDFKMLVEAGNDMQLLMCVWGNNILLDTNGNVTNKIHAQNRVMDLFKEIYHNITPSTPIADWEMIHST